MYPVTMATSNKYISVCQSQVTNLNTEYAGVGCRIMSFWLGANDLIWSSAVKDNVTCLVAVRHSFQSEPSTEVLGPTSRLEYSKTETKLWPKFRRYSRTWIRFKDSKIITPQKPSSSVSTQTTALCHGVACSISQTCDSVQHTHTNLTEAILTYSYCITRTLDFIHGVHVSQI